LYKFQSWFLPGHSTNHQLIELYHEVLPALDNSLLTSVTFCDISRGFDRVWIRRLIFKLKRYGIKDRLLRWLNSYLENRNQRVVSVLKDGISEAGNVRAGVPQGSALYPLLFLVYVNDIADEVLGLCRLFADDTTDIDFSNLSKWSEQWLVKLNPNKTDIMVFSIRNREFNSNFILNNIHIDPVASHRHLGVYFSSDCKWTIHINKIIEKASKQLNVLRQLKCKLDREYLERIYLTFILPILEYSYEVWDNWGQMNVDRLEKINLEDARIITGLTIYSAKNHYIAKRVGKKLSIRREQRKLVLFYKITQGQCPEYLTDLMPPLVSESTNYNLRSSQNYTIPLSRLTLYQKSFFQSTLKLWNDLDLIIRNSPSVHIFKRKLKKKNCSISPASYISLHRQSKP
jgi:hypothetical protein